MPTFTNSRLFVLSTIVALTFYTSTTVAAPATTIITPGTPILLKQRGGRNVFSAMGMPMPMPVPGPLAATDGAGRDPAQQRRHDERSPIDDGDDEDDDEKNVHDHDDDEHEEEDMTRRQLHNYDYSTSSPPPSTSDSSSQSSDSSPPRAARREEAPHTMMHKNVILQRQDALPSLPSNDAASLLSRRDAPAPLDTLAMAKPDTVSSPSVHAQRREDNVASTSFGAPITDLLNQKRVNSAAVPDDVAARLKTLKEREQQIPATDSVAPVVVLLMQRDDGDEDANNGTVGGYVIDDRGLEESELLEDRGMILCGDELKF